MLVGLHTHTYPASWDSFLSTDEAVERAKEADLGAMVLSEHDWAWDADEVRALARRHNFTVIAGMELNTEDGHVICFGIHEYIFGMHRADELAGHVAAAGGTMIAAHPYRRQLPWRWDNANDYEEALQRAERNMSYRFVTALETINGRGILKENTYSMALASRMGMPSTGADDCHEAKDVNRATTYFERDIKNERDLIEALQSGRFWPIDRTGGKLLADADYHGVPDDLEQRWAELAEIRRERHANGAPEFTGRPADHPHVLAAEQA